LLPSSLPFLLRIWIEEVGFEAHGSKKQLVKLMGYSLYVREFVVIEEAGCHAYEKISLGERCCWGSEFSWRESINIYNTLRLLVQPVTESLEGNLSSQWTVVQ